MRKLGLFVGLTLFALAGSARAQDEAPAAAPAADSAAAPAAEPGAAPAAEAPAATPAVATEAPAAAPAAESKMQVGVAFVTGVLSKWEASAGGSTVSADAAMPFGVALSFGYNVIPGLSVGIAPQALFNVKPKNDPASGASYDGAAAKEFDIMARIAYAYHVIPNLAVYAEVMPGYSIISLPSELSGNGAVSGPKGFVLAGGVGGLFDINDQFFVNLAVGYQLGLQKTSVMGVDIDMKTKGLRLALGGGLKF
jgi:hypothetical protein